MEYDVGSIFIDDPELGPVELRLGLSVTVVGGYPRLSLSESANRRARRKLDPVVAHICDRVDQFCPGRTDRSRGDNGANHLRPGIFPDEDEYRSLHDGLVPRLKQVGPLSPVQLLDLIEWAMLWAGTHESARVAAASVKSIPTYKQRYADRRPAKKGNRVIEPTKLVTVRPAEYTPLYRPTQWRDIKAHAEPALPRLSEIRRRASAPRADVAGWTARALEEALVVSQAARARPPELFEYLHSLLDELGIQRV